MSDTPTTFAVLTPPGAAAVATIAIAGPEGWNIVRQSFRPAGSRPLPEAPDSNQFWYGQFGDPPGDAVVMSARQMDGQVYIELHCHGGPQVVRMICDDLARLGATPGSSRTVLALPPLAWAARTELSRAPTLRTAAILLDQCAGAFDVAVHAIGAALAASNLDTASRLIADLSLRSTLGRRLTRPWTVAIAGAPNVGKSSLVNALAGYQRSVVTPIPGTTRDVVGTAVAIDGWPIELIDTAGQHAASDDLEEQGIARGRSAAANADLCLWIVDGASNPVWPDPAPSKCIFVVNKSDLPPAWNFEIATTAAIISARIGAGVAELCDRVSRVLVPDPPPPGAAVPFTPDLANAVEALAVAAIGDIAAVRAAFRSLNLSAQPTLPG